MCNNLQKLYFPFLLLFHSFIHTNHRDAIPNSTFIPFMLYSIPSYQSCIKLIIPKEKSVDIQEH